MNPYRNERIENAICFFVNEHTSRARKPLPQTFLYKYLAFLDFISLEETGQPVLELKYCAMDHGPVPIEIYSNIDTIESDLFRVIKGKGRQRFFASAKAKPDLDYFSIFEIRLMRKLIEIFADRFITTDIMSEASHQEIKAWRDTYKKKPNSMIDYALTFKGDIHKKTEKELTYPEEIYLTFCALGGRKG
ncbi:MAG TPA: Panacea domain-containing protein [Deltaproteobacteria bacterium]|nr:Panacea domain-containing protein [Deltaproteobacteria bacterium]